MNSFCPIPQNKIISPLDFKDFIILPSQLRATLGSLGRLPWATFGFLWFMRVALGDFWKLWGSLWAYDAYMCGLGGAVFDLVLAR